ncbi:MAG: Gfo/Idh/MocA family oxidoreductase [Planctomycetaceae bacterium]
MITPEQVCQSIHVALPTDRSVGIGCIGAGFIMADCHLVAYRQHGLNPVAITSRTRATADAVAERHHIPVVCSTVEELVQRPDVRVLDVAVPPDCQADVIRRALGQKHHLRAILAQKPLGRSAAEAADIVRWCEDSGILLGVNQNMRYDQSVRACHAVLKSGVLGEPVLATIDMRAIPHWMPWQERQGWVTLRIMSIHHLDTFRYWLGDPDRIFCSVRPDPRTSRRFPHQDGIVLSVLEYDSGVRASAWDDVWAGPSAEGSGADIGIRWRVEGTLGMAKGTIGWPAYPQRVPSTLEYTTVSDNGNWHRPQWDSVWFPDAFVGPMADILTSLEQGTDHPCSGRDNLKTMALVDAAYRSAEQHQMITLRSEN